MRKVGFVFAFLMLPAAIASANEFSFSYHSVLDNSVSASGQITATLSTPGVYDITGVTGQRNGVDFTFVANPDAGVFAVDKKLYVPQDPAYLSANMTSGFVIQTTAGFFNPYWLPHDAFGGTGNQYYEYYYSGTGPAAAVAGTQIAFTVPEPGAATLLLSMLAGLVGMTGILRKK